MFKSIEALKKKCQRKFKVKSEPGVYAWPKHKTQFQVEKDGQWRDVLKFDFEAPTRDTGVHHEYFTGFGKVYLVAPALLKVYYQMPNLCEECAEKERKLSGCNVPECSLYETREDDFNVCLIRHRPWYVIPID